MSIMCTQRITQQAAIDRIKLVHDLISVKAYRSLEAVSNEPHVEIWCFVDTFEPIDVDNLSQWTNTMLADLMDCPFFRYNYNENYEVHDD